jgi:hypothetical protein
VQHVDDSAAVVDQRLEDRLDRGAIRGARPEADDREQLTGGRNRAVDELPPGCWSA